MAGPGQPALRPVRLDPALPTGPLNDVLGMTSISPRSDAGATFAFLLPPSILIAAIGSELGGILADEGAAHPLRGVSIVSAAATALLGIR